MTSSADVVLASDRKWWEIVSRSKILTRFGAEGVNQIPRQAVRCYCILEELAYWTHPRPVWSSATSSSFYWILSFQRQCRAVKVPRVTYPAAGVTLRLRTPCNPAYPSSPPWSHSPRQYPWHFHSLSKHCRGPRPQHSPLLPGSSRLS